MSARRFAMAGLLGLALTLASGPATAARYDLSLGRYFTSTCDLNCAQQNFENLVLELGQILAPIQLSPAETAGLNGFTFGIVGTIAPISNTSEFWSAATEGNPDSVLFIPRIHVTKGLPFSFEIGTQLAYIPESELFAAGAELKWALNEGFYFIPDLAVRFSLNHMIGAKDFELTTGGWDISLSKAFGIGGMLALTPYAGYNMYFVHSSSHVVIGINPDDTFTNYVFTEVNWQDHMLHRFFVGLRLTTFIFQVILEGVFNLSHDFDGRTIDGVSMFNFKLGFDY
jgi:hypothetical protein